MFKKSIYGVVRGNGHAPGTFSLHASERAARAEARELGGRVYRRYDSPDVSVWDAPTFMYGAMFITALMANRFAGAPPAPSNGHNRTEEGKQS